ncbi:MAG: M23 family peptidase, partial [Imperialibacter sp.]
KEKSAVYSYSAKGNLGYVGGAWDKDGISFLTTSLGTWTIATDSVPPTIKPAVINKSECRLIIQDDLSGIKSWKGTIDGEWVLLNYEYKKKLLWTEKLEASKPFDGEFVLVVTDNAGNETVYKTKL